MERKEAIEVIKKNWPDSSFTRLREALETVIPELKESKDERIRKALIKLITNIAGGFPFETYGIIKKEAIAWLEKQAKCEIDYPKNHQDSNCPNGCIVLEDFNGGEGFYKVHLDYLSKKQVEEIEEIIRVWNKELKTSNEKQGEKKPTQEIEPTPIFRIGDVLKRKGKDYTFRVDRIQGGYYHCDRNYGAYFPIEDQDNWELVEQNPAWTPMDEQRVENLLAMIEGHGYPGEVAWLNSLKDRVQPKQEWSEEDEEMLNSIIARLHSHPNVDLEEYSKEYDWLNYTLKSLNHQSTWKPSDAQMNALSVAVKHGQTDDPDALKKLLEQLKKLREK